MPVNLLEFKLHPFLTAKSRIWIGLISIRDFVLHVLHLIQLLHVRTRCYCLCRIEVQHLAGEIHCLRMFLKNREGGDRVVLRVENRIYCPKQLRKSEFAGLSAQE